MYALIPKFLDISYDIIAPKFDACSKTGLFISLSIISSFTKYAPDLTGGNNPPLPTIALKDSNSISFSFSTFNTPSFRISNCSCTVSYFSSSFTLCSIDFTNICFSLSYTAILVEVEPGLMANIL